MEKKMSDMMDEVGESSERLWIMECHGMMWVMKQRGYADMLGLLPEFLHYDDWRSAIVQFDENYSHGGGWRKFNGFALKKGPIGEAKLSYVGDPDMQEVARCELQETEERKKETVIVFQHSWVAVVKDDGTYEVARMD